MEVLSIEDAMSVREMEMYIDSWLKAEKRNYTLYKQLIDRVGRERKTVRMFMKLLETAYETGLDKGMEIERHKHL